MEEGDSGLRSYRMRFFFIGPRILGIRPGIRFGANELLRLATKPKQNKPSEPMTGSFLYVTVDGSHDARDGWRGPLKGGGPSAIGRQGTVQGVGGVAGTPRPHLLRIIRCVKIAVTA